MTDWFVYQQDVYPNDLDPDILGVSLLPQFDDALQVMYRDDNRVSNNGLRRVKSVWGVDRDVIQFDFFIQTAVPPRAGLPPLHSSSPLQSQPQTIQWLPKRQRFRFANAVGGFHFENSTLQQCLVVTRDANNQSHAKLYQKDTAGNYALPLGSVMIVRIHKLTMLMPNTLDTTMFSKFMTAHTQMGTTDAFMKQS